MTYPLKIGHEPSHSRAYETMLSRLISINGMVISMTELLIMINLESFGIAGAITTRRMVDRAGQVLLNRLMQSGHQSKVQPSQHVASLQFVQSSALP